MTENDLKIPKRRFKEFENADAWEQCELKDVANHRGGTAIEKHFDENGIYKVISIGSYGLDSQYIDQGIRATSNDITNSRLVRKGELTMVLNDKTANGTIIGRTLLIDSDNKYVINQRTEIVSPKENLDSNFAYVMLNGPFREKVKRIVQGGTQIYVNYPAVEKLPFELPTLHEQKKIGSFFQQLDHLITLHQRKLEKTKTLKQAYLSEMFPAEGEREPKRRFAGYTDAWEQRKLGNYAEILTGGTPKTSIPEYWEPKNIPWMSSGEVNKRRLDGTDNMISEEGLHNSSARWIKENSILIALAGQGKTRGTVAINNIPLTTNQSIAAIVPVESLHYEFIFQNLIMRYDELRMISSGDGTRGGLNKQIISDIVVPFPSKDEQQKIGAFFKNLDQLITLHQRKLEKLQNMKQAYLNEMFV